MSVFPEKMKFQFHLPDRNVQIMLSAEQMQRSSFLWRTMNDIMMQIPATHMFKHAQIKLPTSSAEAVDTVMHYLQTGVKITEDRKTEEKLVVTALFFECSHMWVAKTNLF
jgi:hypothetical protein